MKTLNLKIPISIFKEGRTYIVHCTILDVSGVGRTQKQAQKRFQQSAAIFFEETLQHGTLNEVMTDLGWHQIKKTWTPPLEVSHHIEAIQIPVAV